MALTWNQGDNINEFFSRVDDVLLPLFTDRRYLSLISISHDVINDTPVIRFCLSESDDRFKDQEDIEALFKNVYLKFHIGNKFPQPAISG